MLTSPELDPWHLWRTEVAPEAQVALDQALKAHLHEPTHPGYWWARIAIEKPHKPARPPWIPNQPPLPFSWEHLCRESGDLTKLLNLTPLRWCGIRTQDANSILSTPIYRAYVSWKEMLNHASWISFSLGVPAPYRNLFRSGPFLPTGEGIAVAPLDQLKIHAEHLCLRLDSNVLLLQPQHMNPYIIDTFRYQHSCMVRQGKHDMYTQLRNVLFCLTRSSWEDE